MGQEFELKYAATPAQLDAIRASFGPFRTITMETTYYDTPDRALSSRKWTLRRRMENGISVCTLKTPGSRGARCEWETEAGDILSAIPGLCKLGAPPELKQLVSGGVMEVCGARFTRLAAEITMPDCILELALDQGALLGGGRELPLCEAEVELKKGSRDGALRFACRMALEYGLTEEHGSKFRRALALTIQTEQEKDNGI